jgi:hypothetical protein
MIRKEIYRCAIKHKECNPEPFQKARRMGSESRYVHSLDKTETMREKKKRSKGSNVHSVIAKENRK